LTLGPCEKVDHESGQAGHHDKQHPEDGRLHPPGGGVARHPGEQDDVHNNDDDRDQQNCAAERASGRGLGVIGTLSEKGRGEDQSQEQPETTSHHKNVTEIPSC